MKASLTRSLVIMTTLGMFCFLGITPGRAQSSGSSGGCCGGQSTANPATSAATTSGVTMACGSGTTQTTTANGTQCVNSTH
jgi:hypothetical protein